MNRSFVRLLIALTLLVVLSVISIRVAGAEPICKAQTAQVGAVSCGYVVSSYSYDAELNDAQVARADQAAADFESDGSVHGALPNEELVVARTVEAADLVAEASVSIRRSSDFVAPSGAVDDLVRAACRSNSFVPGTLVLMADGSTQPVEDVEIGDWVWAHDPETGEAGPRRVVDTIVGDGSKDLVDVDVLGDTITATDGHPFWVADDGAWIDAGDLEVGDQLLLAYGHTTVVAAIDKRVAVQRVHNLTVEGIHTYYVQAGDEHVLVHNCRPEAGILGSKKHGVDWTEGPARARSTGLPQGQWAADELALATDAASDPWLNRTVGRFWTSDPARHAQGAEDAGGYRAS